MSSPSLDTPDCARLLSLVAHELRTPLSVTLGYLSMLTAELAGPLSDTQRNLVESADRSCRQLVELVADVSLLGRLERGEPSLSASPISLATIVVEAVAHYTPNDAHPVGVVSTGQADVTLTVDPVRFRSVISALINATVRSSPSDATIAVHRAVRPAHNGAGLEAVVAVARDGESATLADAARDALHPIDPWQGGLGMTIPIAQRLIALAGGDLRATHVSGTRGFVLFMPVRG